MAWRPLAQPQLPDFYRTELANQQLLGNALKEGFNLITHKVIENDLAERYGPNLYSPEALQERVVKYSIINPELAKMFSNQLYTSELAKSRLQTAKESKDYKDDRAEMAIIRNLNTTNSQYLSVENALTANEEARRAFVADNMVLHGGTPEYKKELDLFDKKDEALRKRFSVLERSLEELGSKYKALTGNEFFTGGFDIPEAHSVTSEFGTSEKKKKTGENELFKTDDEALTETGEGDEEEEKKSLWTRFQDNRRILAEKRKLTAQIQGDAELRKEYETSPELKKEFSNFSVYTKALVEAAFQEAGSGDTE
tara:strand:- start:15309 stop:16241 length:933 start_codon:yes stop_codon:yes gene_type:complete